MDADSLCYRLDNDTETISSDSINLSFAICQVRQPFGETLSINDTICQFMHPFCDTADHIDLQAIQENDPIISFWKQQVESGKKPSKNLLKTDIDYIYFRNFSKLCIRDSILFREVKTEDRTISQTVVPRSFIPVILEQLHNKIGHLGRDRTLSLVRQRFY